MKKEVWIKLIIPAIIFVILWMDGWFYPLILLPLLYVLLVEKKKLRWLGFRKDKLRMSAYSGAPIFIVLGVVYFLVFLYYFPLLRQRSLGPFDVFDDIIWYPIYEELAYRSFFLAHFAKPEGPLLSRRNLGANLTQSLMFLAIHHHHVTSGVPLILIPVFLLGFLNGLLFLRTRNIYGCIVVHAAVNALPFLLILFA